MNDNEPCYKKCYRTKQEAKNRIKINFCLFGDKHTTVYYCEDCSAWHGTTIPKQISRNITKHRKK